jgi:hypothetical protein
MEMQERKYAETQPLLKTYWSQLRGDEAALYIQHQTYLDCPAFYRVE